jgi:alpha-mannosidase
MEIAHIVSVNKDDRIKYIPLEEATMPVISKGENNIGSIQIDSSMTCKQDCYLGLSVETNSK